MKNFPNGKGKPINTGSKELKNKAFGKNMFHNILANHSPIYLTRKKSF